MSLDIVRMVPLLRSFDEARAKAFYLGYLGCTLDFEHRFEPGMPLFFQASRGRMIVQVSEHHGDGSPGSAVRFIVNGLRDFHQELRAKDYPSLRPGIEQAEWGADEMTLLDPFGNRLIFTQRQPGAS